MENTDELTTKAIMTSSDVEDFLESYDIKNLIGETELTEYITKADVLKRDFRRSHALLKRSLGDQHKTTFPLYEKHLAELTKNFKDASKQLNDLRARNATDLKLHETEKYKAQDEKEKVRCATERKFFLDQTLWEIRDVNWDCLSDLEAIRDLISNFESRLDKFGTICSEYEIWFGDYMDAPIDPAGKSSLGDLESISKPTTIREENFQLISSLRDQVLAGRSRFCVVKADIRRAENQRLEFEEDTRRDTERERLQKIKNDEALKISEIITCAKSHLFEIRSRSDHLRKKCTVDFSSLSDHDILDMKKREEHIHSEFRELIDKISSFETFIMPCGPLAAGMRDEAISLRDKCSSKVDFFIDELSGVVKSRDISERKLKNSPGLKIELKKFRGYDSELDIFTFRSSFKKLVEPEVQGNLLADILKKNYLDGPARNLVSKIESVNEIWDKLFEVYGNTQLLLQNKISALGKIPNLEKLRKEDQKTANAIIEILNLISDLCKLASEFNLEEDLFHGPALSKIFCLLGSDHERKFIKSIAGEKITNRKKWDRLVSYLEKELTVREAWILNEKVKKASHDGKGESQGNGGGGKKKPDIDNSPTFHAPAPASSHRVACSLCDKTTDHILSVDDHGQPCVDYVACKTFVDMNARERGNLIIKKRLCGSCLKPGAKWKDGHVCDTQYVCGHTYTIKGAQKTCSRHVLVCGFHSDQKRNEDLLTLYKKNVISKNVKLLDFSKNVSIACFSQSYRSESSQPGEKENAIFAFQTIDVAGMPLNLFFDGGCGHMVCSRDAADRLAELGRADHIDPNPLLLRGVNKQSSICPYGEYTIRLPLSDSEDASFTGICVDEVTEKFPIYPLDKALDDFRNEFGSRFDDQLSCPVLPRLPASVGGKVDVMIGTQYLKHFPFEIGRLNSGLTLYRSVFSGVDGSTGIISGPHHSFTEINRASHFAIGSCYYSAQVRAYFDYLSNSRSVPLLGYKDSITSSDHFLDEKVDLLDLGPPTLGEGDVDFPQNIAYVSKRAPPNLKIFDEVEKSGTNISYRCCKCRECKECLRAARVEEISIVEEAEQDLINKSVTVDTVNRISTAILPFTADPDTRLATNRAASLKVYHSQVKRLNRSDRELQDALAAEKKLQDLGYVEWVDNLDPADRDLVLNNRVLHFLAWHIVRSASVTTPCRPVFNASAKTPSGYSLNDILPKGTNNMNNLVEVIIRWSIKRFGYHTDVRKMYNSVTLDKRFWRFQLYWWSANLGLDEEPLMKVIMTCIYGVKPSGNQAERVVRAVAEEKRDEFPLAYDVVMEDVYVDDCISGEDTEDERNDVASQLQSCLAYGGFTLKGFTFSGEDPDDDLSKDGSSIMVGGQRWYPKDDFIMLNTGNFDRKDLIPLGKLTMRDCASLAAQVFDPKGIAMPVTAGIKLDISHLHRLGLKWDDPIPENLREIWKTNLEMLEELGSLKYNRVVVPPNAKNLNIFTIDTGDASPNLICTATYARFECTDGTFSCQLVFARSKVVPEGTSVPRAELMAAAMNAATGFTVQKAFGSYHHGCIKLSDSMVALHWISSITKRLKTFIRTLVIEINRLCDVIRWRYVESSKMPADIGTRKGATLADINQESEWINGKPWMRNPVEECPLLTIEEINLNQQDMVEAEKEQINFKVFYTQGWKTPEFEETTFEKIKSRYQFSNYIIDPNCHPFRMVVRILSLVLTFIKTAGKNIPRIQSMTLFNHKPPGNLPDILRPKLDRYLFTTNTFPQVRETSCKSGKVITVSEEMLKSALYYFSLKASLEVQHFLGKNRYKNLAKDIDGVLYYTGRILPDQQFGGYPHLAKAALDLCHSSFCVPLMDQFSPVAVSIALDIHWNHPDVRHRGVAAIFRQMMKVAYILGGFSLAASIKNSCKKCRILNKSSIDVAMGPLKDVNLCIAPAFYASQVDIFGPFKSYSSANKRATIKVWFVVFCCCTTGAVDIRVLEDYSTDAFVQGFIRFSCRVGYPRYLLPDPGSQLVKGCQDMTYSFVDTKQKLFVEYGVDFFPCPVGAHYMHGKVERKIREIKKSVSISVQNERLSVVQWETLMAQIGNSINNLPIGLKNRISDLEQLDLITPNRLILGRNNDRCGNAPLVISPDHKKMIETNANIFRAWFDIWLVSYVPTLIERPKWHASDPPVSIGDIVLFLKSEREFDLQYQYGMISDIKKTRDGLIRTVTVEYQNHQEGEKRSTERGTKDLVMISPVDELDIYETLNELYDNCT